MQRVVTIFLTIFMCFIILPLTFSGCGKNRDNGSSAISSSATQQTVSESSSSGSDDVEVDFSDLQ